MADPDNALRVLKLDPFYAFGEREGCLLGVWRGQPTEASFEERNRFMLDLTARLPGRCGYLEVIEPGSKPPSPAARKVAAACMREVGKSLSCVGIVVEGNELRSALVRAVLAGMQLLIRWDHPVRVDKDVVRSAEWVREKIGAKDAGVAARLAESIEILRARMPRG
jgi:hypothetical protein